MVDIKYTMDYPLKIFKNKWVIKSVIFTCLFLAMFLVFVNICADIFPEFYQQKKEVFTLIRGTIYAYLQISVLGYFISKYTMCFWSVLSYYIIVYLKVVWIVYKCGVELSFLFTRIESVLLGAIILISLYYLFKQRHLIKQIK